MTRQYKKDKKFVVLDRTPSTPQRNVAKRKRCTMGILEVIYDECGVGGNDRGGSDKTADMNGKTANSECSSIDHQNREGIKNCTAMHKQIECFVPIALIGQGDFSNVYLIRRNVVQRFDFNTDINGQMSARYGADHGLNDLLGAARVLGDGRNCNGESACYGTGKSTANCGTTAGENRTANNRTNLMDRSLSALKISTKALLSATQKNEYLTEIQILKALRTSPHAVKLHRAWSINSYLYVETEHCNLGSFFNLVEYVYKLRKSALSERFVTYFMMEMCAALVELKRAGVMHCDVAPGNILMSVERGGGKDVVREIEGYVHWYCETRGYVIGEECTDTGRVDRDGVIGEECADTGRVDRDGSDEEGTVRKERNARKINIKKRKGRNSKACGVRNGKKKREGSDKTNNGALSHFKLHFKLADFNISKFAHSSLQQEGTPRYLSKEALTGSYHYSSDLFSLAMIWLEIKEGIDLPSNGAYWHELREGRFECSTFCRDDERVLRSVLGGAEDRMDVERVYAYFKGKYDEWGG